MNLFLDFDGTLIDSRERLYRLFQYFVPRSKFTFQEYWEIKRQGLSHSYILSQILTYSESEIVDFNNFWHSKIELPEWLALDEPFANVSNHLRELKRSNELHLVTARQNKLAVHEQLVRFGWTNCFSTVLVTEQTIDKKTLIERSVKVEADDWMISDAGKDIETGKALGMKTAAVLSGFLSRETLTKYNPDLIIESILDFKP